MISEEEKNFNVKMSNGLYSNNTKAIREKRETRPDFLKTEKAEERNDTTISGACH